MDWFDNPPMMDMGADVKEPLESIRDKYGGLVVPIVPGGESGGGEETEDADEAK